MSRGLSKYQAAILEVIRKEKEMTVIEIWRVYYSVKHGRINPFDYEEVREIPMVTRIYRTMLSLERRGFVGRLLHRRPARWFAVSWEDGKPCFVNDTPSDYDDRTEFTTKGQTWITE